MKPGQVILNVVLLLAGAVMMAWRSHCFSPVCILGYLCLTGGMLAVYTFAETLLAGVLEGRLPGAGATRITIRPREEKALEAPSALSVPPEDLTMMGRLNLKILRNPWIAQLLERDYYGLAQRKDMEPPVLLLRMEKFGLGGAMAMFGLTLWAGIPFNPGLIVIGFLGGFAVPHLHAGSQIRMRQKAALMNLPSFVDLLALTIESGLDYLNSMEKILATTFKNRGALEEEVDNVMREVALGYPRRDALRHMARRVDVQEVRSLVGLLIQSDELGTGLVQLLRNFSQDMRNRRTGKAEEMAGKASTKMLGPMMIFIFPVIFVLILAPFAASLMKGGGMSF
ncbi:MAG: type II secretion system F family protein [Elusimicrobia bacterium]|nr:type II secretion system F family protein [Elusimicrobiota bacterium]